MTAGVGNDADGYWCRERSISLCRGPVGRVRGLSRSCRIMYSMMHSSSRRSVRPSICALCSLTCSFAVLNGACNGYCTPRNANESSYHVRVSIPTIISIALSPPTSPSVSPTQARPTNTQYSTQQVPALRHRSPSSRRHPTTHSRHRTHFSGSDGQIIISRTCLWARHCATSLGCTISIWKASYRTHES